MKRVLIMKKKYFVAMTIFLFCYTIYGQINTNEKPISFRLDVPALTISAKAVKSFAPLDMKKIELEDKNDETNGRPPRFGYPHKVNYNLDNAGEWVTLATGDKIWRLVISCQNALSINLLYDKFWIPDGAKFFVYGKDRKQTIGAMTSANNKGKKDDIQGFATGLIFGDQITLEYYLPKGVKETGIISVSNVIHGYRYTPTTTMNYGSSGSCQVNVNCSEGNNWQNEKNAVAMILVNGYRYCTGSLINTTANDGRPLFLTADHCLGGWATDYFKYDADTAPNLSHWSFYWHYESPVCANIFDPPFVSTSGATVVANNSILDFALLQLWEDPLNVAGITPYYLGWDRSNNPGAGGVGIHHPAGDLKKISTYTQIPMTASLNGHGSNVWDLSWIQTSNGYSITEGGSSGSPLINNYRRVIGQCWSASTSNCYANQEVSYGKFNLSWTGDGATDNRRRLRDWLDPNNTGVWNLDGDCGRVVNYSNTIVTGNVTVTSCGTINVQNVTVQNGARLTLNAKQVNITEPFNVQNWAEFIINVSP